jgi:hypothetical protein
MRWPALAFVLMLPALTLADDPIAARLEKARAQYETEGEKIYAAVADAFQKAETQARRSGDKAKVDALKSDKAAFELTAAPPKSVPLSTSLQSRIKANRTAIVAAYAAAVKEYTKAEKDDLAAAAQAELGYYERHPGVAVRLYLVVNKNSGLCLTPGKGEPREGQGVAQEQTEGKPHQVWSLVPGPKPGTFGLRNYASGRFLHVPGGSRNPGTPLVQWGKAGTDDSELWWLEKSEAHWRLRSAASGLYVGVREGKTTAGADVIQWSKAGDDQLWEFRPVVNKPMQ